MRIGILGGLKDYVCFLGAMLGEKDAAKVMQINTREAVVYSDSISFTVCDFDQAKNKNMDLFIAQFTAMSPKTYEEATRTLNHLKKQHPKVPAILAEYYPNHKYYLSEIDKEQIQFWCEENKVSQLQLGARTRPRMACLIDEIVSLLPKPTSKAPGPIGFFKGLFKARDEKKVCDEVEDRYQLLSS